VTGAGVMRAPCGGCGSSIRGDGHAEADGGTGLRAPVDLGDLVVGAGEADLESFNLAEPAFAFGFGDAGGEVLADLGDPGPLRRVGPVQAAPQAAVLMDAGGPERAPAGAGGDFAAFENGRGTRPIRRR
jgi:hypothetical protein